MHRIEHLLVSLMTYTNWRHDRVNDEIYSALFQALFYRDERPCSPSRVGTVVRRCVARRYVARHRHPAMDDVKEKEG